MKMQKRPGEKISQFAGSQALQGLNAGRAVMTIMGDMTCLVLSVQREIV